MRSVDAVWISALVGIGASVLVVPLAAIGVSFVWIAPFVVVMVLAYLVVLGAGYDAMMKGQM